MKQASDAFLRFAEYPLLVGQVERRFHYFDYATNEVVLVGGTRVVMEKLMAPAEAEPWK